MTKILLNLLLIFIVVTVYGQNAKLITFEDLSKMNGKYYLAGDYSKPYTGHAINRFPLQKVIRYDFDIVNGICIKSVEYDSLGYIYCIQNFNQKQKSHGLYLQMYFGDTTFCGYFNNGIKKGRWLETINDSTRQIVYYKSGKLIKVVETQRLKFKQVNE